jgi:carbamate kinase
MPRNERKLAAVAIGGNSLIKDKKHPEVPRQWEAARETCVHIADMVEGRWDVVVTHGNGPQVGFILRRAELAQPEVHDVPIDIVGADTQGSIGYMLQQSLQNEFRRRGIEKPVATVVTQVLVDANDPAFQNPTKPIGSFVSEEKARQFEAEGWQVAEDKARGGWRRVIASPQPRRIVELDAIQTLIGQGFIVIAVGGGGIPVVEDPAEGGDLRGRPAVIDKDLATSLLAASIEADLFLISTDVEKVAIHFNTPDQQWLDRMTVAEARKYQAEGHFGAGSMGPKIEAVLRFLESGGEKALITTPENIYRALEGKTGTWIVRT